MKSWLKSILLILSGASVLVLNGLFLGPLDPTILSSLITSAGIVGGFGLIIIGVSLPFEPRGASQ